MKKKGLFDKFRCWLDGSSSNELAQEMADLKHPPRKSEDFMTNILRSLDAALQDEMFVPPKGAAQIPSKFVVFLNSVDDALWQKKKRTALEKNLSELLFERATELADSTPLSAAKIEVKIRADHNLVPPMFQVVAFWDEEDFQDLRANIANSKTVTGIENEFFRITIFRDSNLQTEIPIHHRFVLIGRGTETSEVEIVLDNPEISRIQACLSVAENNRFRLTNYGINPVIANQKTILTNETVSMSATDQIQIANFKLKISQSNPLNLSVLQSTRQNNPFATVRN